MAWLIVIGDQAGLRWVVDHDRMAFRDHVRGQPETGDDFALYVSRGAFHNPTRDEAQVLGSGRFTTGIQNRKRSVDGEAYGRSAGIEFNQLLPERGGLPFKPLVESMSFIAKKAGWAAYLRQTLVPIPQGDFDIIDGELAKFATEQRRQT